DEVGSHLRFGDPGVRLIAAGDGALPYFTQVPAPYQVHGWVIAPYYHLFGSDELTQRAPVIQRRMPQACVRVCPEDAARMGASEGATIELSCAGEVLRLPLQISRHLQPGQVGLPLGMPGVAPVLNGVKVDYMREAAV
ncbi:MAG: molybdopterin dinucleotide binding domain-containing protein, partial [Edwardsiella piscicida]